MTAFLGVFQDLLGSVFVAIASGPAFQLSWGSSAELEKFLPMLLHKVEDPGDGRFLFCLRFPEGFSADVDVKAAGLGLVGTVAQRAGCAQDFRPGHLFLVVLQAHGMRDQLEAVAEGTVVLTVKSLGEIDVGLRQDPAGIVAPLAAFVNLQLDPEVSGAGAVEDGFRFVVVALDHVSVCFLQTGQAERLIAVVQIVTVLTVDEAATFGAGHVALVVAGLAEGRVVISRVVSEPDPLATAGAEGGFVLQALWADEPVVEWDELIRVVNFTAEFTGDFVFFHGIVLLDHFPSGKIQGYSM